jgi:hypothetical protein
MKREKVKQRPIYSETKAFEYPLDLRKLPVKYKKIHTYIAKDRDTGCECEIIVQWGDVIIYRTDKIHRYNEIKERIKNKSFKLSIKNDTVELLFTAKRKYHGKERRKSNDRRSGGDRRSQ